MRHRSRWYERAAAYLPLIGTAIILTSQNFIQGFMAEFRITLALATIAVSFVLVAWHLESRLEAFSRIVGQVTNRVDDLAAEAPRIFSAVQANFQLVPLGDGFKMAAQISPRVEHLRILAASGSQMHTFIQHNKLKVDRCSLLVQRPAADEAEYASVIETVIERWKLLVHLGRIGRLEVLRYDFRPTEYECILDSAFLIHGLFDPNPLEDSGLTVRDPMVVNNQSLPGSNLIDSFVERYDRLFNYCRTGYGSNDHETVFLAELNK